MVENSNSCLKLVFELSNVSLFDQALLRHMMPSIVSCQSMCCPNALLQVPSPVPPIVMGTKFNGSCEIYNPIKRPVIYYSSACILRLSTPQLTLPGIVSYSTTIHLETLPGIVRYHTWKFWVHSPQLVYLGNVGARKYHGKVLC